MNFVHFQYISIGPISEVTAVISFKQNQNRFHLTIFNHVNYQRHGCTRIVVFVHRKKYDFVRVYKHHAILMPICTTSLDHFECVTDTKLIKMNSGMNKTSCSSDLAPNILLMAHMHAIIHILLHI